MRESSRLVARYSYGIYLTHIICIWLAFVVCAAQPWAVQWLIFLTTVVALPVMLYHTIEAPMIATGRWLVDARRMGRELPAAVQLQTS